jgi:hypothetical protein
MRSGYEWTLLCIISCKVGNDKQLRVSLWKGHCVRIVPSKRRTNQGYATCMTYLCYALGTARSPCSAAFVGNIRLIDPNCFSQMWVNPETLILHLRVYISLMVFLGKTELLILWVDKETKPKFSPHAKPDKANEANKAFPAWLCAVPTPHLHVSTTNNNDSDAWPIFVSVAQRTLRSPYTYDVAGA